MEARPRRTGIGMAIASLLEASAHRPGQIPHIAPGRVDCPASLQGTVQPVPAARWNGSPADECR
jgi:hypothetical protein